MQIPFTLVPPWEKSPKYRPYEIYVNPLYNYDNNRVIVALFWTKSFLLTLREQCWFPAPLTSRNYMMIRGTNDENRRIKLVLVIWFNRICRNIIITKYLNCITAYFRNTYKFRLFQGYKSCALSFPLQSYSWEQFLWAIFVRYIL